MADINKQKVATPALQDLHSVHYMEHLAQVNQTQDVTTSSDIYNTQGVLVARKGVNIHHDTARRIAQHKLAAAIEQQIVIADSITTPSLAQSFEELSTQAPDIKKIHDGFLFEKDFYAIFSYHPLHPVLLQKLSVLKNQKPSLFAQSVFCSWLAALIGREMELPPLDLYSVTMAALVRDIGLLHLPPILLEKTGAYTFQDWHAMQSHSIVSGILVEHAHGMPASMAWAVVEHHERYNGMGYPKAVEGKQLGLLGQIVALADSIAALRFKKFNKTGGNIRDVTPFLQMNGEAFHPAVYAMAHSILGKSNISRSNTSGTKTYVGFITQLHDNALEIQRAVNMLANLPPELIDPHNHHGKYGKTLAKVITQVLGIIIKSGMVRGEIITWLDAKKNSPEEADMEELREMELMQAELLWQLNKVQRTLNAFFTEEAQDAHPAWQALKRYADHLWPGQASAQ